VKHKNNNIIDYWFLAVFSVVIIACTIIYIKNFYDDTKRASDKVIDHSKEITEDYDEYELTKYEDLELKGSEVVNFIKDHLGDYTAGETAPYYVRVKTVVSGVSYSNDYVNKVHIKNIRNVSALDYFIKPTAYFYCEIIRSRNKVILGISFTQK
jgi:hypothetical protein